MANECSDTVIFFPEDDAAGDAVVRQIKRNHSRHIKSGLIHETCQRSAKLSSGSLSDCLSTKLPMQIKTRAVLKGIYPSSQSLTACMTASALM